MSFIHTPEEWAVAADLAQRDLFFYSKLVMAETRGVKWQVAPHHHLIFDTLMQVYLGNIPRLLITIPPRYSKSQSVLNFVTWALGHNPDSEFIFVSYSDRLATTQSWQSRELVKHEVYRHIFPELKLDSSSGARDEWRTTAGGCVYAVGQGGALTGFGAGKMRPGFGGALICDDLLKADDASSDVMRTNCIEWMQSTLFSRVNNPKCPLIVIAQRLHEEDPIGWLLAGGTGEEWHHLNIPAIAEEGDVLGRPIGTALWPEKHSIEALRLMERASPLVFAGQYQQRPAPASGAMFKPDEIRVLDQAPKIKRAVRAWDLAATEEAGDHTAGVLIGETENDRYVVLDVVTMQGTPDAVENLIVGTAYHDGFKVRVSLPQDPGQAGKAQISYYAKKLTGFRLEASPEWTNKTSRAEPWASQVNLGNFDMVRGDWNLKFINELRFFPFGKYDDQIDAGSRAFMILTQRAKPMVITDTMIQKASRPPMRMFGR